MKTDMKKFNVWRSAMYSYEWILTEKSQAQSLTLRP